MLPATWGSLLCLAELQLLCALQQPPVLCGQWGRSRVVGPLWQWAGGASPGGLIRVSGGSGHWLVVAFPGGMAGKLLPSLLCSPGCCPASGTWRVRPTVPLQERFLMLLFTCSVVAVGALGKLRSWCEEQECWCLSGEGCSRLAPGMVCRCCRGGPVSCV